MVEKKIYRRFDVGEIKSPVLTAQGYIKADGLATRSGIFLYMTADGEFIRELRPPDEVFNNESLKSLAGVPITNDHPPVFLDSKNTGKFQVGFTGDSPEQHNDFVRVGTTITDKETIENIMSDNKRELSCGYNCELHFESGTYDGEEYDAIQRNIEYNHLSIVDMGRAGPDAKLKIDAKRMDANCALMVSKKDKTENNSLREQSKNDTSKKVDIEKLRKGDTMTKIKIGKVEYAVEDSALAQAVEAVLNSNEELTKNLADAAKASDKVQAKLDTATEDLAKKDTEIKKLEDAKPSRKDSMAVARARLDLEAIATKALGEDEKFDDIEDLEVKKMVIGKLSPKCDLTEKSEDYIAARFDSLVELMDEQGATDDGKVVNAAVKEDDLDKIRAARQKRDTELYKTKCPARVAMESK